MYPNGAGSNIGNLLRLIQEDANQSINATLPSAQPGSPMRGVVQQPLQSPEAPNSSHVISTRPEGVIQAGPQAAPQAAGQVVAPVAPVAPSPSIGGVVAPALNNVPPSQPSRPNPTPVPTPTPIMPSIGTSITASPSTNQRAPGFTNILDYNRQNFVTPSRLGSPIVNPFGGNKPTPTPAQRDIKQRQGSPNFRTAWLS